MREIKFRAWSEVYQEMYTSGFEDYHEPEGIMAFDIGLDDDGNLVAGTNDKNGDLEDLILEQYTGIKDKNGIEIYEGDVLKQGKWIGIAECLPGRFMIKIINHKKGVRWHSFFSTMDEHSGRDEGVIVIGNIHRNPDLLTQKAA